MADTQLPTGQPNWNIFKRGLCKKKQKYSSHLFKSQEKFARFMRGEAFFRIYLFICINFSEIQHLNILCSNLYVCAPCKFITSHVDREGLRVR